MVCSAGRRGSLEVDGYTSSEEESGGLLTGLNTSGNLYIGTTYRSFTSDIAFCIAVWYATYSVYNVRHNADGEVASLV